MSLLNRTQLYRRKSLLYRGVRTLLCRCWTQPNYIGVRASCTEVWKPCCVAAEHNPTMYEVYVPLCACHVPVHKGTKEDTGAKLTACLLSVESESSMLYLLDVLLGTPANTLRCPGATETREMRANVAPVCTWWWLCCVWSTCGVSQATLVSETKEAHDMVLTSDWLKWR